MATTSRPSTPRTTGLRTQTQTQVQVENTLPTITTTTPRQPVLHLRGATREQSEEAEGGDGNGTSTSRRIQWAEDVVDNEGMGKKKSKVCCIYHAPKGIDESSDESSSDSSSDESGDDGSARPARRKKDCGHGDGHDHGRSHGKGKRRERSPNAYEKMPKPKNGGAKEQS